MKVRRTGKRMAADAAVILLDDDDCREIASSSRSKKRVCITIDDDGGEHHVVKRRIVSRVFPDVVVLPDDDDDEDAPNIECSCCFTDCSFHQLVQCADGHLFCFTCLKRHVEEAAFGAQARTALPCMDTSGCTAVFPWSQIIRAVPADVLEKYEKRLAEDAVARARLDGLVYCPFCNVPCVVDPDLELLRCPNRACSKTSCLKCRQPDHSPEPCKEEVTETTLRRRVEELMTKALVRVCTSCKAEVVKLDGCNKVRCRCGNSMCYVCHQQIRDYSHFCQAHQRDGGRGKTCIKCSKCRLDGKDEPGDAAVKKAKAAALQEAALEEPDIVNQKIGPDLEQLRKKKASNLNPRARKR